LREEINLRKVTFSQSAPRIKRALQWLGAASSLLFVFACLLPSKPRVYDPLDESWMEALHSAFLNHLQFGHDIIYTYGPWGFLFGGYLPETHFLSSIIWVALGIIFWGASRRLARASFQNAFARWLWVMAFAGLTTLAAFPNTDARVMCFLLFPIALHFFEEDESAKFLRGALIVSLGLLSLVKFTVFIISVVVIATMAMDIAWRRRRFPWCVVQFGGSLLLFWLMAGQRLSLFGSYLRSSFQVTSGYTEAMAGTNPGEATYIGCFLLLALISLGAAAFAMWRRLGFFSLFPLGALGFMTFVAFKHGFVRDDNHQAMASVLLLLTIAVSFALFWPAIRERRWWTKALSYVPIAAACVYTAFSFHRSPDTFLTKQLAELVSPKKWFAPIRLLYDCAEWRESWEQYLASYRDIYSMPPLKGNVDFYSWNLMPIFTYGLPYHPRPMPQSFSAYTPQLARLNADHLKSDQAAETILFDGATIDQRYLPLDDGLSWPELLTRYDVREVQIPFVMLQRATTPRHFTLTLLQESSIKFGESFSLPQNAGPLWAEIEIDRTLTGSLVSTLFKLPMLALNTTLRNGQQHANRFVPAMARSGFILSPYIADCNAFAALASDHSPLGSSGDEVASFNIASITKSSLAPYYKSPIHIRLYRLDYPRQNLDKAGGYLQVVQLKEALAHAALKGPGQWLYVPEAGSVVATPPGTAILLDRPKNSKHLQVRFGLHPRGGRESTNGITFAAYVLNAQQQATPIWNRHIAPGTTPNDRGEQKASVDLANSESPQVVLITIPDSSGATETLCPYWSEMRFEPEP
jgi:hypothetical protein